MIPRLAALPGLFLLPWLSAQQPDSAPPRLHSRVQTLIGGFAGEVFLYAKNLDTGASYGFRENDKVRTASTIKLPVMVAAFHAVASGKARWDETLALQADDIVSGSGVLREFSPGMRFPLRDLVHLMIVVSDNTATNLILDRISADYVNARMDELGLPNTRSLRKILGDGRNLQPRPSGFSAAGRLEENRRFGIGVSTSREMVALLEKLERGEVLSREASRQMIAILKRQQYKDGIGRRLQAMPVASKSGALDALRSDVGIVYAPGGRVAMAITVDRMPAIDYSDDNPGLILIAELARAIVEEMAPAAGRPSAK